MTSSDPVSVLHVDDKPNFADMAATFLERTDERLAVATTTGASEAISAGVTDYLQKKVGTSQYAVLANRITNAVRQYRSERELDEN